jgi:GNAT superfamily N-acetyltransferase
MAYVDDAEGWRRLIASLAQWSRTIDGASEGMRSIDGDGLVMTITPAVPERSIVNDVVYWDGDALLAAYDELDQAYEAAGIGSWVIWVPDTDDRIASALSERGHVLDSDPEAMVLDLDGIERPPELPGFSRTFDLIELARLNDRAYGMQSAFARALAQLESGGGLYAYGVEDEEGLAAGLVTFDYEEDCSVWLVATRESARRRGLASALMRHAMADARERGHTTSTLQATDLGRPVYERMGYRSLGEIQMWEKRRAA